MKIKGIGSGGSFQWFFQRITGVYLLLVLLVHFWVLHFFPDYPADQKALSFDMIMERLSSPVWKTLDLSFLYLALYHGIYGFIINLQDYCKNNGWRLFITAVVWIAVVILGTMGTIAILSL